MIHQKGKREINRGREQRKENPSWAKKESPHQQQVLSQVDTNINFDLSRKKKEFLDQQSSKYFKQSQINSTVNQHQPKCSEQNKINFQNNDLRIELPSNIMNRPNYPYVSGSNFIGDSVETDASFAHLLYQQKSPFSQKQEDPHGKFAFGQSPASIFKSPKSKIIHNGITYVPYEQDQKSSRQQFSISQMQGQENASFFPSHSPLKIEQQAQILSHIQSPFHNQINYRMVKSPVSSQSSCNDNFQFRNQTNINELNLDTKQFLFSDLRNKIVQERSQSPYCQSQQVQYQNRRDKSATQMTQKPKSSSQLDRFLEKANKLQNLSQNKNNQFNLPPQTQIQENAFKGNNLSSYPIETDNNLSYSSNLNSNSFNTTTINNNPQQQKNLQKQPFGGILFAGANLVNSNNTPPMQSVQNSEISQPHIWDNNSSNKNLINWENTVNKVTSQIFDQQYNSQNSCYSSANHLSPSYYRNQPLQQILSPQHHIYSPQNNNGLSLKLNEDSIQSQNCRNTSNHSLSQKGIQSPQMTEDNLSSGSFLQNSLMANQQQMIKNFNMNQQQQQYQQQQFQKNPYELEQQYLSNSKKLGQKNNHEQDNCPNSSSKLTKCSQLQKIIDELKENIVKDLDSLTSKLYKESENLMSSQGSFQSLTLPQEEYKEIFSNQQKVIKTPKEKLFVQMQNPICANKENSYNLPQYPLFRKYNETSGDKQFINNNQTAGMSWHTGNLQNENQLFHLNNELSSQRQGHQNFAQTPSGEEKLFGEFFKQNSSKQKRFLNGDNNLPECNQYMNLGQLSRQQSDQEANKIRCVQLNYFSGDPSDYEGEAQVKQQQENQYFENEEYQQKDLEQQQYIFSKSSSQKKRVSQQAEKNMSSLKHQEEQSQQECLFSNEQLKLWKIETEEQMKHLYEQQLYSLLSQQKKINQIKEQHRKKNELRHQQNELQLNQEVDQAYDLHSQQQNQYIMRNNNSSEPKMREPNSQNFDNEQRQAQPQQILREYSVICQNQNVGNNFCNQQSQFANLQQLYNIQQYNEFVQQKLQQQQQMEVEQQMQQQLMLQQEEAEYQLQIQGQEIYEQNMYEHQEEVFSSNESNLSNQESRQQGFDSSQQQGQEISQSCEELYEESYLRSCDQDGSSNQEYSSHYQNKFGDAILCQDQGQQEYINDNLCSNSSSCMTVEDEEKPLNRQQSKNEIIYTQQEENSQNQHFVLLEDSNNLEKIEFSQQESKTTPPVKNFSTEESENNNQGKYTPCFEGVRGFGNQQASVNKGIKMNSKQEEEETSPFECQTKELIKFKFSTQIQTAFQDSQNSHQSNNKQEDDEISKNSLKKFSTQEISHHEHYNDDEEEGFKQIEESKFPIFENCNLDNLSDKDEVILKTDRTESNNSDFSSPINKNSQKSDKSSQNSDFSQDKKSDTQNEKISEFNLEQFNDADIVKIESNNIKEKEDQEYDDEKEDQQQNSRLQIGSNNSENKELHSDQTKVDESQIQEFQQKENENLSISQNEKDLSSEECIDVQKYQCENQLIESTKDKLLKNSQESNSTYHERIFQLALDEISKLKRSPCDKSNSQQFLDKKTPSNHKQSAENNNFNSDHQPKEFHLISQELLSYCSQSSLKQQSPLSLPKIQKSPSMKQEMESEDSNLNNRTSIESNIRINQLVESQQSNSFNENFSQQQKLTEEEEQEVEEFDEQQQQEQEQQESQVQKQQEFIQKQQLEQEQLVLQEQQEYNSKQQDKEQQKQQSLSQASLEINNDSPQQLEVIHALQKDETNIKSPARQKSSSQEECINFNSSIKRSSQFNQNSLTSLSSSKSFVAKGNQKEDRLSYQDCISPSQCTNVNFSTYLKQHKEEQPSIHPILEFSFQPRMSKQDSQQPQFSLFQEYMKNQEQMFEDKTEILQQEEIIIQSKENEVQSVIKICEVQESVQNEIQGNQVNQQVFEAEKEDEKNEIKEEQELMKESSENLKEIQKYSKDNSPLKENLEDLQCVNYKETEEVLTNQRKLQNSSTTEGEKKQAERELFFEQIRNKLQLAQTQQQSSQLTSSVDNQKSQDEEQQQQQSNETSPLNNIKRPNLSPFDLGSQIFSSLENPLEQIRENLVSTQEGETTTPFLPFTNPPSAQPSACKQTINHRFEIETARTGFFQISEQESSPATNLSSNPFSSSKRSCVYESTQQLIEDSLNTSQSKVNQIKEGEVCPNSPSTPCKASSKLINKDSNDANLENSSKNNSLYQQDEPNINQQTYSPDRIQEDCANEKNYEIQLQTEQNNNNNNEKTDEMIEICFAEIKGTSVNQSKTILKKSLIGSPTSLSQFKAGSAKKSQRRISFKDKIEVNYFESETGRKSSSSRSPIAKGILFRTQARIEAIKKEPYFNSIKKFPGISSNPILVQQYKSKSRDTKSPTKDQNNSIKEDSSFFSTNLEKPPVIQLPMMRKREPRNLQIADVAPIQQETQALNLTPSSSSSAKASKQVKLSFLEYSKIAKQGE